MPSRTFPKNFLWGCAAASYQIEGACDKDGKGPSIWDAFCEVPGAIKDGRSGSIACDHYHRLEEDLDLMKELGLGAYRFSISWPRVIPAGRGAVNEKGIDFYDRLVDGLLARGIQPAATCYHWDLPLALEKEGGWRVRSTVDAFQDYAALIAKRLGDRVRMWFTLNEMSVVYTLGYKTGVHAPGAKEPEKVVRQAAHHLLLAHGVAVKAIRANATADGLQVGLAQSVYPHVPFYESDDHIAAARREFEKRNAWLMDPFFKGKYPEEEWEQVGPDAPDVRDGDMEIINDPGDFLGINLYAAPEVVHAVHGVRLREPYYPRTDFGWPITPECLYWAIRFCNEVFGADKMYITESGCCYPDEVNSDGLVEDYARIHYLRTHLDYVLRAAQEGLPIHGYFIWSIMDNFEWAEGYTKRFGIIHVNYETLKRTPKLSYEWYGNVIRNNGFKPVKA